jgi:hypothetical protein
MTVCYFKQQTVRNASMFAGEAINSYRGIME